MVSSQAGLLDELGQSSDEMMVVRSADGRWVRFLSSGNGRPFTVKDYNGGDPAQTAIAFMNRFGPLFGLQNASKELSLLKIKQRSGRSNVRLQQVHSGIPVLGGELIVQVNASNRVECVIGESQPVDNVSTTPSASEGQAKVSAVLRLGRILNVNDLSARSLGLWIYVPGLIGPKSGQSRLVWRLELTSPSRPDIRQFVLVDAQTGTVTLNFNMNPNAKDRDVYDAGCGNTLPGSLVRSEGQAATGNADQDNAYDFSGDTYDFYSNEHGRDSIDNAGMTIISTVNFDDDASGCDFQNAFWDGSQMVYGPGFSSADDVVGHELTHGVTEHESGLLYYYQSGAINESFSDIWGEFIDQVNGKGTDTAGVKWQMGEDIPGFGVIRDMKNPSAFGDPDRMGSTNWSCSTIYDGGWDRGGVHTNSGVGNKLAYLLTDGDSFNGQTVTGMGIPVVADLFYEVQIALLTSGADYRDLCNALKQAAINLGWSSADQTNLDNACAAVEICSAAERCDSRDEATICTGLPNVDLFYDDFEGANNWSNQTLAGTNLWSVTTGYATNGTKAMMADTTSTLSQDGTPDDSARAMTSDLFLPANAYLHFRHVVDFEYGGSETAGPFYDGGVLEYSTNGGTSWNDAGSLIVENGYNGTISSSSGNPLGGRSGFVGCSHGYIASRLDLSTLVGQNVRLRFRAGTDIGGYTGAFLGWGIDEFRIYTCGVAGPWISSITPNSGTNDGPINITNLAGAGFEAGATVQLTKSGQTAIDGTSVNRVSATKITCTFDLTGKTTGQWNVVVTNPDAQSWTLTNGFTIRYPAPTVTSITPSQGLNTGTIDITDLSGTNFLDGATVKLTKTGQTDITATNVAVTSTKITCRFDLNGKTGGQWNVVVTNPDAQAAQLTNGFRIVNPAPTVTSITPNSGQNTGSVNITNLVGTGFRAGATVKLAKTGQSDITASSVVVASTTNITCTFNLTGKLWGAWDVVVTNDDTQAGTLPAAFTITNQPPALYEITPTYGDNNGSVNITDLRGAHFISDPPTIVKLKKTAQTDITATGVTVVSSSKITCTFDLTGAATGTWDVAMTMADAQSATLAAAFTVKYPAPVVTGVTPSSGLNSGVTDVSNLAGSHFMNGAMVKLRRAGQSEIVATNVVVESATKITCQLDLTNAVTGLWDLVVSNTDGQSGTLASGFTVKESFVQPDGLIKRDMDPDSSYAAYDVYQDTPSGNQVVTQSVDVNQTARYQVKVINKGNTTRTYTARATETSDTGWQTTYMVGVSDITGEMHDAVNGHTTASLAPGACQIITVEMSPGSTVPGETSKSAAVGVFRDSSDTTVRDSVKATATVLSYSIAGTITKPDSLPLEGVTVVAGGKSTATAANGSYTLSGLTVGIQTVTPSKTEYVFDPISRNVPVGPNTTAIDFTGTKKTYSVGGTVQTADGQAIADVTVSTASASTTTDASGNYTLSGLVAGPCTVTASKTEYTFAPPSHTMMVGPGISGVNFTGTRNTYTIGGYVRTGSGGSISGATVTYDNGTTTTDAAGKYQITGLLAGTYNLSVSKAEHSFDPASRSVSVGPSNLEVHFTGTRATYSISGTTKTVSGDAISGVKIIAGDKTATTDANGAYTLTGLVSGSYVVTVSKDEHTFDPASSAVTLGPDKSDVNFTGTRNTYSIGGWVKTSGGEAVEGVTITISNSTTTTDANGHYELTGFLSGTYTIIPSKAEHTFDPTSQNVTIGPSKPDANFTVNQSTYAVSGSVKTASGQAIAGVTISAAGVTATTDVSGNYTLSGLLAGTYTIIAEKAEYTFDPTSRETTLGPSQTGVNFTGTRKTYHIQGSVKSASGAPIVGAKVTAGGILAETDNTGSYLLDGIVSGTYTVSVSKDEHTFDPASREVTLGPSQAAVDFVGARKNYSISGTVATVIGGAISGATVSASGKIATTDASGQYEITGLFAATYTVTVSKSECVFTPTSSMVSVGPSKANVNFTGVYNTYALTGTVKTAGGVGISEVTITVGSKTIATDASGKYTVTDLVAGTYTVTPAKQEYSFDPVGRDVTLGPNASDVNFIGTQTTYTISGYAKTASGQALSGVTVSAGNISAITDSAGSYQLTGLVAGTYSLTPVRDDYVLTPVSRLVSVGPSVPNVNFSGVYITIDLQIRKNGEADSAYAINDIYQSVPSGNQVEDLVVNSGVDAVFYVKIENDSKKAHAFTLQAEETIVTGWNAAYRIGNSNVTSQITSTSGYTTDSIVPSGSEVLTVTLTPRATAPGGSTKTVIVKAFNETGGVQDSVRANATVNVYSQPDAMIRKDSEADSDYESDDVYQQTPADDQIETQNANPGLTSRYRVRIQNDGNLESTFTVKAAEGEGAGWIVHYRKDTEDVSSAMLSTAGYTSPSIAPGQSVVLTVDMISPFDAAADATKTTVITVEGGGKDAVTAVAKVNSVTQPDALIKECAAGDADFQTNNVYQASPAGLQVLEQTVQKGSAACYSVKVENDGNAAQAFLVKASESATAGWTVNYRVGSADINAAVHSAAGYQTASLAPGAHELITVEMTPGTTVENGAADSSTIGVYLNASDAAARDSVAATTTASKFPAPTVTGVSPDSSLNNQAAGVTVVGSGFRTGSIVKLTNQDAADIYATNISIASATKITCKLDLIGKPAGVWNVVVVNPDDQDGTLSQAFTIKDAGSIVRDVSVRSLSASPNPVRRGSTITFTYTVANEGTVTERNLTFRLVYNGQTLGRVQTIAALNPGQQVNGSTRLTIGRNTPAGEYPITGEISAVPAETNSDNNRQTVMVTVK